MAVWPYSHNLAIWLHSHMALWLWLYPRWVSTERAIKMLHCGQKIKLIRPFCEKWEPKCSAGIFSFVFFRISFVKQKVDVGRLGSKKMLWCIKWNALRIGFYLIIGEASLFPPPYFYVTVTQCTNGHLCENYPVMTCMLWHVIYAM